MRGWILWAALGSLLLVPMASACNGMSPGDIQYQQTFGLLPVSPSDPKPWKAGPGMTDTLVSNFADVLNKPNMIPDHRDAL